jgi:hypothetical protein
MEHLLGHLCNLDEDIIVDLEKTGQLEGFCGVWGDFIDTTKQIKHQVPDDKMYHAHPQIWMTKYT